MDQFTCPACGETFIKCDLCKDEWAIYEAWVRRGISNIRVRVCAACIPKTIAGEAGKTAQDAED